MAEKRVRTSARDEQLGHTTPPARGARSYGVVARKTRSHDTAARNTDSYDFEGRKVRSYETPSPLRSQRGKRLSRNGTHAAWLKRCPARMKIYIRLWAHVGREARSYEFPFRAMRSYQCASRPLFAPAARLHPTRGASRPPRSRPAFPGRRSRTNASPVLLGRRGRTNTLPRCGRVSAPAASGACGLRFPPYT